MNTEINIKPWLLDLLALIENQLEVTIANIPENKKEVATDLKNWSHKDQLNHLIFWNNIFVFNAHARQNNQPIVDPKNYLVMNDISWFYGRSLTWKEIETALKKVITDQSDLITSLSLEEIIDGDTFTMGYSKKKRPFVEDFLYEIVDHPIHHMMVIYEKLGNKKEAEKMLSHINEFLQNPQAKSWTAKSRRKIDTYLKKLHS